MTEYLNCWNCSQPAHLSAEIQTDQGELVVFQCTFCNRTNFYVDGVPHRAVMWPADLHKGLIVFRTDPDGHTSISPVSGVA